MFSNFRVGWVSLRSTQLGIRKMLGYSTLVFGFATSFMPGTRPPQWFTAARLRERLTALAQLLAERGTRSPSGAPLDGSCFMPGNPSTALPPLCRGTRPPQWLTAVASTLRSNQPTFNDKYLTRHDITDRN